MNHEFRSCPDLGALASAITCLSHHSEEPSSREGSKGYVSDPSSLSGVFSGRRSLGLSRQ